MKVELKVVSGPYRGKQIVIEEYTTITVVRSQKAYLPIPQDKKLSRFHCILEILPPDKCFLKDLNSANGTFLCRKRKEAFEKIGEAWLESGEAAKSRTILETVVAKAPTSARYAFNLSLAYERLGDHKRQRKLLQRSLKLDPEYVRARKKVAELE